MKILAIGATGFVGSHVTHQLMVQGHQVALFHRGSTTTSELNSLTHFYGRRNQLPNFKAQFEQFSPDVVLDIIPFTEAQAQDVVQVFSNCTQRLVAISSGDVYRNYEGLQGQESHPPDPVPLTEDAPLRETRYPYRDLEALDFEFKQDYDKILVEQMLMEHPELPATILRLPAMYGPGERQHRFLPYLRQMFDQQPILLEEEQAHWRFSHGYVENIAAAITLAVTDDRAAGRIYNLGEASTPTLRERIQALGNLVNWHGEIVTLPRDQLPSHLQMNLQWQYHLATDTTRFQEELGYVEAMTKEEALRQTIAWELENLTATSPESRSLSR
ncbi:putative NAD-dependent epimerase/dehydratase [Tolypothrix tenuis PCC 7101]|uniref:Putative NAD-dependent epimerase/dehydratase n=1 Tax=Tolypothrix tenuis PCC 7101 TaxID=231146 RepID=A0A1Z4NAK3_9CYAN|nr:NAD-dependent epimerase/dehydratase family protein [Aulosira sp. FACHB-113]BAZ02695.1 putative NAD-dependent epimerase/dehydratase [Tolypothrix tenuis PCC 7101]BAZ78412.1 putative NAD-dependent epimerase/dehydratase [Aulosira laxa NIES-50]